LSSKRKKKIVKEIKQDERKSVKNKREEVYGEPYNCHMSIAHCWSALLDIDIAPHQVALMLAMFKMVRMKYKYQEDNYVDCFNYLEFAMDWQELMQEKQS